MKHILILIVATAWATLLYAQPSMLLSNNSSCQVAVILNSVDLATCNTQMASPVYLLNPGQLLTVAAPAGREWVEAVAGAVPACFGFVFVGTPNICSSCVSPNSYPSSVTQPTGGCACLNNFHVNWNDCSATPNQGILRMWNSL